MFTRNEPEHIIWTNRNMNMFMMTLQCDSICFGWNTCWRENIMLYKTLYRERDRPMIADKYQLRPRAAHTMYKLAQVPIIFFATIIPIVRLSLKDSPLSSRTESKAHTRNICIQSLSFGNYKRKNVKTIYFSLEMTTKAFINTVVYILTMFFVMIIRGLGNEFCGNTSLLSHDQATPG